MWNLFTVGSLQFPNDSTIASLEANKIILFRILTRVSQDLHKKPYCEKKKCYILPKIIRIEAK